MARIRAWMTDTGPFHTFRRNAYSLYNVLKRTRILNFYCQKPQFLTELLQRVKKVLEI
jgi:hypothetical protein